MTGVRLISYCSQKTFDLHLLAGMELSFKNAGEDLFVNGLVQIALQAK